MPKKRDSQDERYQRLLVLELGIIVNNYSLSRASDYERRKSIKT